MYERMIVLDTETTGLEVKEGHRIIEIGCVELVARKIKRTYQQRINPQRPIDPDASKVHQIYDEDLKNEPVFNDIIQKFLDFIESDVLIIHNAPFDIGFINNELRLSNLNINTLANEIVDTLDMARRNYPGQRNRLDDLCKRLNIDASSRNYGHGALVDAKLLAQVYLGMTGGQVDMIFSQTTKTNKILKQEGHVAKSQQLESRPLIKKYSTEEKIEHEKFIKKHIKYVSNFKLFWENKSK